ncbi:PTS sugar transporter subunit IIC [Pectobacterium sp. A5351]|uniref:PTS sugar transporter subunit IIC n=1 Tax=Pectobacterium sp. A5351 TaxID=2914983 RepID=UPI0023314885|nr:PTS sugar transporter subunit IIC [Pectobacterium sp. A5351]WCG81494.1 PTS sugar transporter subunit IIC [Pectobacterium sp. A5351]
MAKISEILFSIIENKLTPIAAKISNQRHIIALRDGFIAAMPFLIVGSFMLIFAHPPFDENTSSTFGRMWLGFAKRYSEELLMPFNMTMGLMSIFITGAIAYNLAQMYKLSAYMASCLAVMSFLLVSAPVSNSTLSVTYLSGEGIFTGILVAIYCTELMYFLKRKDLGFKLPEQVPSKIRESFDLLIPVLVIFLTLYPISIFFQHYLNMLIPQAIMSVFAPLISASDSLPAILIAVLLVHLLWFAGIHGAAVVGGILQVFYITNLSSNQSALNAGLPIEHIFVESFWSFFIVLGGSGATLGLALLYWRSRSVHLKTVGRLGLVPGFFNINEPLIFGSPIIMNPIMFIPFIGAPLINATIAWSATKLGWVNHVVSLAPWTTPAPVGAAWATGWDYRAVILVVALTVISMVVYYPFFKLYEKQLLAQEKQAVEEESRNNG